MKGVLRPQKSVLPDAATVPKKNQVPVPRRFTHELITEQPFYYTARGQEPAGTLSAGSRVRLDTEGRARCRVVDARGLVVYVACGALEQLER
ncbi:MAG: hypothetical protein ABIT71_24480 [Vicinamibacteraceae bacterium]